MGYRDYPSQKRISVWGSNNALMMIIIINVLIFIFMHFIKTIYGLSRLPEESFYKNVFVWFTLPADPGLFIQRPWTLVTSFFTHIQIMLLLSNLFWLWTFGYILQDLAGERKLLPLYLYGGLTGSLVFLATFNLVPSLEPLRAQQIFLGATPAVLAVAIGTTVLSPQYRIFPMIGGGIPLWVLALVFVVIDIATLSSSSSLFYAHLCAAIVGFLFSKGLQNGIDASAWMNRLFDKMTNLFNPTRKYYRKELHKQEVFYNTRGQKPFIRRSHVTQQKIDEILDKINQKGFQKLSDDEKDLLRRASEEDL